jgi:hypothetical protein
LVSGSSDSSEIRCEAPPPAVVQACQRLGFRAPQDARWCRARHSLAQPSHTSVTGSGPGVIATGPPDPTTCTCGEPIPALDPYAITFALEKVADYLLGQCCRCGMIFWNEG